MMECEKRPRKRNFSDTEIRTLVEEVLTEGTWLLGKDNTKVTNKRKEEKWQEIALKVSACGCASRTGAEVKEKFKKMRNDVIARQREATRAGWRRLRPPVLYEDVILQIIESDSNPVNGGYGNGGVQPCTVDGNGQGSESVFPVTLYSAKANIEEEMIEPQLPCDEEVTHIQDGSIISINRQEGIPSTSAVEAQSLEPSLMIPMQDQRRKVKSYTQKLREELSRLKKRRLQQEIDVINTDGDQSLWNDYLLSKIEKNQSVVKTNELMAKMLAAKTLYFETMARKAELEIEKMKKE